MQTPFLSRVLRATAILAVVSLAACQSTPPRRTVEPDLKLLETSVLVVPKDCFASGSFIVSFTVATTGRTDAIRAPDAPGCVQDALIAWVASFRYEPPARAAPATMEWMMVTGKRGS
jgi:hypothetical protein